VSGIEFEEASIPADFDIHDAVPSLLFSIIIPPQNRICNAVKVKTTEILYSQGSIPFTRSIFPPRIRKRRTFFTLFAEKALDFSAIQFILNSNHIKQGMGYGFSG
jgi:hypothetical protein